jgi:CPA1 family monovalent cation:H+ antiporter
MRLTGYATWEILVFLLNALLFVLIGLQLPQIVEGLEGEPTGTLVTVALVVPLVVIACRLAFVLGTAPVIRALDRRPSQRARRAGWRQRSILGWSGMRGSVSLAAALALPADFPARDTILLATFSVILCTLVLQGLTLPALIRALRVEDDGAEEREELIARRRATAAALDELERLAGEEWTRGETVDRMRGLYEYRARRLGARAGEIDDGDGYEHRSRKYQKMVRRVLDAQRDELVRLRNAGAISNEVMHRLERELDLEDERLEI